ncbi:helicase [Mycobacterium sp. 1245111.1]|uniref:DISARM system helicase DrmA n=1 Tax=Mycobacterium sp. 1245111.1 TaxID=1834073 RepID=UPI0007FF313A|nr:DISARM system helicase DrmA [Mycobacterium sp. 1245111.1]OBK34230.1 helicase [Mycobacterium sp. 1245111.1]
MTASTSTILRGDLLNLIERELLGPRDGNAEELKGTPRAAYVVGALAPVTIDPSLPTAVRSESGDPNETGVAITDGSIENSGQRGVSVNTDEEAGAAEEGEERDEGPKGALTHPSSMGLRFQVPGDSGLLAVKATWGRYQTFRQEDKDGRKVQWSRRIPFEKIVEFDVRGYDTHVALDPIPLEESVTLRVELFPRNDRVIVELALSNDKVTDMNAPPGDWLFQTKLQVEANSGEAVFLPTRDVLQAGYDEQDEERQRLDLQYRHRLEFAVGRTTSVTWSEPTDANGNGIRRAASVETNWLPTADIPQTKPGSAGDALTSMRQLAELQAGEVEDAFAPLINGYLEWLEEQKSIAEQLPDHLQGPADDAIAEAELAAGRLREGVDYLTSNPQALHAFRFMNRAMRDQRTRSQVAIRRAADDSESIDAAVSAVESQGDAAASWRPFQLAFVLLQIPALTEPAHPFRSGEAANVELLFFPTGGGKTEAYLGLAAYTFAIRRLQGKFDSEEGALDGGDGVAVLMRYTLRLLTSQQFQRAAALVCAAELIRQEDETTWGDKPFSIGLWVGTSVSPKRFAEAKSQVEEARSDTSKAFGLTVLQLQRCPWCGTKIDPKRDLEVINPTERIAVYCGDRLGDCPFSSEGAATGALPILTVDDEIYRNPPTFLLATVDKFARLTREGPAASLFGYVSEWCPRHGYRHPDSAGSCKGASHNAIKGGRNDYPKVTIQAVDRLRPPDLIIQDELHLITGSLGTAVGLFENAVDLLCSYRRNSETVRPMIVASTATVRNAENQIRALYGRGVDMFPPQVLDIRDTYFSREVPVTEEAPGRKYLGVCAHGIRLTLAEIRVSEILLLAGQKLLDESGADAAAADPYMTTVAYFSATRELAGMRRYLDDDVTTRVTGNTEPFPKRTNDVERLNIGELTSRISSEDISATLDKLSLPFTDRWSTQGRKKFLEERDAARAAGKPEPEWGTKPYDFVLATSMLQVGVDVPRLGLMLVVGQPKNTAEYIQASSRVGRDASKPGLVLALANWARPRDMAHFEQFRHYHETFYAQVEALSVTPYSDTSMERGLMGVLVSVARVAQARSAAGLSPEAGAGEILGSMPKIAGLIEQITARATPAVEDADAAERLRLKLIQRQDRWYGKADETKGALYYERIPQNTTAWRLLISPESTLIKPADQVFVVANSMREVQPEINLLVSPTAENLAFKEKSSFPQWDIPAESDKQ